MPSIPFLPRATLSSLQSHDPFWHGKILIRLITTVLSVLGIVSISCILSLFSLHPTPGVHLSQRTWIVWGGCFFPLGTVFTFNLTTFILQARTALPLHPLIITTIELLVWTLALIFGLVTVFGHHVAVVARLRSETWVFPLEQVALIALFITCILHFLLFLFAAYDARSRRKAKIEFAVRQLEVQQRNRQRSLLAKGKQRAASSSAGSEEDRRCSHCALPLELVPMSEVARGPVELGAEENAVEMHAPVALTRAHDHPNHTHNQQSAQKDGDASETATISRSTSPLGPIAAAAAALSGESSSSRPSPRSSPRSTTPCRSVSPLPPSSSPSRSPPAGTTTTTTSRRASRVSRTSIFSEDIPAPDSPTIGAANLPSSSPTPSPPPRRRSTASKRRSRSRVGLSRLSSSFGAAPSAPPATALPNTPYVPTGPPPSVASYYSTATTATTAPSTAPGSRAVRELAVLDEHGRALDTSRERHRPDGLGIDDLV